MFDVNNDLSSELVMMEQFITNRVSDLMLKISVDVEVVKRVKDNILLHYLSVTVNPVIRNYLTNSDLTLELKYVAGNYIMFSALITYFSNFEEFDEEDLKIISGNLDEEDFESVLKEHFINKYGEDNSDKYFNKTLELVPPLKYSLSVYTNYKNAIADVAINTDHMNTFKMVMGKDYIDSLYGKSASSGSSSSNTKTGCYVATAIYHSYNCPEVYCLRRYRDYYLKKHLFGRMFIRFYYFVSPTMVKLFGKTKMFNNLFKPFLDKRVAKLKKKGYSSLPYND